jgi:hypothetical protein
MQNHHMGRTLFLIGIALISWYACTRAEAEQQGYLHKDLSEQMDALAVLQGSIGEELNRGTPQNADWLVEGLDSVLLLINERLNTHPSLLRPFDKFYKQKLKSPIQNLREAIANGDTTAARRNYILLVDRCNSCHKDHSVEEKAHY